MAPSAMDLPRYSIRLAELGEEEQICAVCREGYLASSKHLLSASTIRRQVERYYDPARVRREIVSAGESPAWQGYAVAVTDDGLVLGAAGGGVLDERIGQVYVLYLRMRLRRAGIGSALLAFLTQQQAAAGATEQWVGDRGERPRDPLLSGEGVRPSRQTALCRG